MKLFDDLVPRRGIYALFALTAVTAVAACGGGSEAPTTSNAQTAPSQSAPSQSGSASGAASAATSDGERINIAQCAEPIGDRVYFRVGDARLGVPGSVIVDAIPSSLTPPLTKEEVTRELQRQAATGAGCPERPLEAVLLVINDQFGHPLLEGTAGLVQASSGITERFAELTRGLQAKPTANCKSLNGQLLACVGTESRGDSETPVMYVITTDKSKKLNTGGPLAARCVLQNKTVQGCNLIDKLPGDLTVDVTLNAGTYTTADLASARDAALRRISGYTN